MAGKRQEDAHTDGAVAAEAWGTGPCSASWSSSRDGPLPQLLATWELGVCKGWWWGDEEVGGGKILAMGEEMRMMQPDPYKGPC